jgi:hypothetical protein
MPSEPLYAGRHHLLGLALVDQEEAKLYSSRLSVDIWLETATNIGE